jgi:hypothetical protein
MMGEWASGAVPLPFWFGRGRAAKSISSVPKALERQAFTAGAKAPTLGGFTVSPDINGQFDKAGS